MKTGMKYTGATIAAVIGLLVLMIIVGALTVFGNRVGGEVAQYSNAGREKSVLFDPNNSIGRYEQFYDDCRSVVALGEKINAGSRDLRLRMKTYSAETDTFGEERKAINGLRESVRALTNQQIDTAQDYNSKSSQTTRSQFKAADLPYTLDAPYTGIECGSPKEAQR